MTSETLGEWRLHWGRVVPLSTGLSALGVPVPGPSPRSGVLTANTPTYSHFIGWPIYQHPQATPIPPAVWGLSNPHQLSRFATGHTSGSHSRIGAGQHGSGESMSEWSDEENHRLLLFIVSLTNKKLFPKQPKKKHLSSKALISN